MVALLKLLRVHHYVKNFFVLAPVFFGGVITDISLWFNLVLIFFAFSFSASAIYIFNDICDVEKDRLHPIKKQRPIANGDIQLSKALVIMAVLGLFGFGLALLVSRDFLVILSLYLTMNVLYSFYLKNIAIIDAIIVAIGFVLRVFGGAEVTAAAPSSWIVLLTFLLALFLAFAKRRNDVVYLSKGIKTRANASEYNLEFLNISLALMSGVVIVSYILYTLSDEVMNRLGSSYVYFTVIFVIGGILRYLQLLLVKNTSGSPVKVVLTDHFIQLLILSWALTFGSFIYF